MVKFAEKLKQHREAMGLNQQQLADIVGVSRRMIAAYEAGTNKPRHNVVKKIAETLRVSVDYLTCSTITDPLFGIEKTPYIAEARELYGTKGAREVDQLLAQNMALFAGGGLDQEAKDHFFEAVMKAYLTCKEEAKRTYGHH